MNGTLIHKKQPELQQPEVFIFYGEQKELPKFFVLENTAILFISFLVAIILLETIEKNSLNRGGTTSEFVKDFFEVKPQDDKGLFSKKNITRTIISFFTAFSISATIFLAKCEPTILPVVCFSVLVILLFSLVTFTGKILTHRRTDSENHEIAARLLGAMKHLSSCDEHYFTPGNNSISMMFFYVFKHFISTKLLFYFTVFSMVVAFLVKTVVCLLTNRKEIIKEDLEVIKTFITIYTYEILRALLISYIENR